ISSSGLPSVLCIMGYLSTIEASGAKVICDRCPVHMTRVFLSLRSPYSGTIATNSAKIPFYAADGEHILAYYGSIERCIAAATTGIWR
ncbi:aconitase X, partial [Thermodesulfobacteriota bacterium]